MSSDHMYTPSKMTRNLGIGNVGEAFFRYWYETKCHGLEDVELRQFGYNPEGVVVGEEKVDMLKTLERSTDFCLYSAEDLKNSPLEAEPILGISINTQKNYFSMIEARAPKLVYKEMDCGCFNCPRGDSCFKGLEDNLWYNEYNISNDYKLFHDEFNSDVFLVTIISRTPNTVYNGAIRKDKFHDEMRSYLLTGESSIKENPNVVDFLDYLVFDQRYKKKKVARDYELVWIKYTDILKGKIPYHITGAPVSRGRPRPVACINKKYSNPEVELIEEIEKMSSISVTPRSLTWFHDENSGDLTKYLVD